jgi:hypothetical protein
MSAAGEPIGELESIGLLFVSFYRCVAVSFVGPLLVVSGNVSEETVCEWALEPIRHAIPEATPQGGAG